MRDSRGFTLIELLVVISIIGVLSTLAVFGLNSARSKSRDSKRVTDVKQIQTALELYYADFNSYPEEAGEPDGVILGTENLAALCDTGFDVKGCVGATYMQTVPLAQTPVDGTVCTTDNNSYRYFSDEAGDYVLTFCLGGRVGSLEAGEHTADPNGIQ
jgi:general secretion pathway protein G